MFCWRQSGISNTPLISTKPSKRSQFTKNVKNFLKSLYRPLPVHSKYHLSYINLINGLHSLYRLYQSGTLLIKCIAIDYNHAFTYSSCPNRRNRYFYLYRVNSGTIAINPSGSGNILFIYSSILTGDQAVINAGHRWINQWRRSLALTNINKILKLLFIERDKLRNMFHRPCTWKHE